ncbi:MAG: hypothetical protein E6Q38_02320 [Crocinitomicaceae bacterium]|nr:MAG: hypothetical protein E6Q38_02320 [Crocinitomicaceae bacterium]
MNRSTVFLILLIVFSFECFGQEASKTGVYEQYANLSIKKVTEYKYNYTGSLVCDSSPQKIQYFNEKGQLIKECFLGRGRLNSYYTFKYNKEGFLVDIDTMGMFSYGTSTGTYPTTGVEITNVKETWKVEDASRRLIESISSSSKDSTELKKTLEYDQQGHISLEQYFTKSGIGNYVKENSIQYFYNNMGLIEKIIWKNKEDEIEFINEYKYETAP